MSAEQLPHATEIPVNSTEVPTENNEPLSNNQEQGLENSIFTLKRPKDIRDGFGYGASNIIKGALGGAAILVGAPIKGLKLPILSIMHWSLIGAYDGASEGGALGAVKGFAFGLGIGVLGGVSMTGKRILS